LPYGPNFSGVPRLLPRPKGWLNILNAQFLCLVLLEVTWPGYGRRKQREFLEVLELENPEMTRSRKRRQQESCNEPQDAASEN